MKSPRKLTPLLKQYLAIKSKHPGRILFFRMGDFYELFGDDAVVASSILGIALTSREHGDSGKIPLAGVPYHTLDRHVARILKAGHKVAVCDQVEDPRKARGIVKREVVEVLTPGSITLDQALDDKRASFIASINPHDDVVGLALLDISTGRFLVDEFDESGLEDNLAFHEPLELVIPEGLRSRLDTRLKSILPSSAITPLDDYRFDASLAFDDLTAHFGTAGLNGFGLGEIPRALGAAGAVFAYVRDLKMGKVGQITRIERIQKEKYMELDSATIKNLELVETPYEGRKNSLLSVIDYTRSPGGGRLIRRWTLSPLKDIELIDDRQRAVRTLLDSEDMRKRMSSALERMPDLERLSSRISMRKAGPRDIVSLKTGLEKVGQLKSTASNCDSQLMLQTAETIVAFDDLIGLIGRAIVPDPPAVLADGGLFRKGYSDDLDRLTASIEGARQYIHNLQNIEKKRTKIPSLKVGFNRVFGYYIEITKPHLSRVPANYIRKQTLVSAERFITEELKTKEELILNAEEKIKAIEYDLFGNLLDAVAARIADIQEAADASAVLDVLLSFARLAEEPGYVMPNLDDSLSLDIRECRHPVMERVMPSGKFIPNDVGLDDGQRRMAIITGPNMAGKSTYLRQAGLVVLLAQMGAPIPARTARIGICDRIFTRVGASDDILRGRSTFMVEMTEAASIINNATNRSLLILDELGRGTSTYDGLSIAWALIEYINGVEGKKARTLFATHYHELIDLAERTEGITNLQVAVKKWQDSIVFLYKIEPGGCDDSYGIQVAGLAGLPELVLDRAREILARLEAGHSPVDKPGGAKKAGTTYQISLFSPEENRIREVLEKTDPERLTPIEALGMLNKLKKMLNGDEE